MGIRKTHPPLASPKSRLYSEVMAESERRTVVVTGASGFIGRALVSALAADWRFTCRAGYREAEAAPPGAEAWTLGDLSDHPDLSVLAGVDAIVHTVARTHVMDDREADPLAAYR